MKVTVRSAVVRLVRPLVAMVNLAQAQKVSLLTSHEKRELLERRALQYQLNTFVETGTYEGRTAEHMATRIDRVITIEIEPSLASRARVRLRKHANVTVHQGDSGLLMASVVSNLTEPALFWLDAHYSSGTTGRAATLTPVESEIKLILSDARHQHILMIDDARDFLGINGYPSISRLARFVKTLRPEYSIRVHSDIITVAPHDM